MKKGKDMIQERLIIRAFLCDQVKSLKKFTLLFEVKWLLIF